MKPHEVSVEVRIAPPPPWLDVAALQRTGMVALDHADWSGEGLSIAIVSDTEITRVHAQYLDDPTPTDVISFDLRDECEDAVPLTERFGGELIVSADTAARCATERGHSPLLEAQLYVVHGALHLLGEDDHDAVDRARMREKERACFDRLGLPYPF